MAKIKEITSLKIVVDRGILTCGTVCKQSWTFGPGGMRTAPVVAFTSVAGHC